jgi:hypothetical protein
VTAREVRVRQLSDGLLRALGDEPDVDVALMGLINAAVRVLQYATGVDSAGACVKLSAIIHDIGRAERTS